MQIRMERMKKWESKHNCRMKKPEVEEKGEKMKMDKAPS